MTLTATFNESGSPAQRLLEAVAAQNFAGVRKALEAGAPADSRDESGNTALASAAMAGNVSIAGVLIGYGADVNAANAAGGTVLDAAAAGRNAPEICDLLLEFDVDPTGMHSDAGGRLLIQRAAMRGRSEALKILLGKGVSPDSADADNATLLVLAAAGGHAGAVVTLLNAGASVHRRDKGMRTPLRAAMQAKSLECVELVLAAGADPGWGDLHSTHETTDYGFSEQCPPEIAAAVKKALQKFLLINAALDGDENAVAGFIAKGEPVNVFNHDGVTALTCAANQKHPKIVKLLLENGADPNLTTTLSQAPVDLSVAKGDAESVALLLKAGATPGPVALHHACGKKFAGVAKVLLENGADPNVTARSTGHYAEPAADFHISLLGVQADDYPLHTAIRNQDLEITQALINAGARTVSKDGEGVTALQRGRDCGNEAIRELVKERYDAEMDMLANSSVTLDMHTKPLRALKFKPKTM